MKQEVGINHFTNSILGDGGQTFAFVNPYTEPFPPLNNGFCCDQVTIYSPTPNAIFWLQQFRPDTTTNNQRINVDQGADGTWECAYDFTPESYNLPQGRWLDFPGLVVGNTFLYHTTNVFTIEEDPTFTNALIARYPLDQIAACGNVTYQSFTVTDHGSFRATHGARNTVYWGSHNSFLTSSLRIYRWAESSAKVFRDDRNVASWNSSGSCPGPDGLDWCDLSHNNGRILGAYLAKGVIGFMWNAGEDGNFAFPHVRIA